MEPWELEVKIFILFSGHFDYSDECNRTNNISSENFETRFFYENHPS